MRVANYLADIGHREFAMIHGVIEATIARADGWRACAKRSQPAASRWRRSM